MATVEESQPRDAGPKEGPTASKQTSAKAPHTRRGFRWGSAFCGWCAAVGLGALLAALLSAAGVAIELSRGGSALVEQNAPTVGVVGGVSVVLCLFLAYFMGGYVAGRMTHLAGGRQGLGVWLWGVAMAIVLAVAGVLFGVAYNLYESLSLPQIPLSGGELTAAGAIVLVVTALATLIGAILGGRFGVRSYLKREQAA